LPAVQQIDARILETLEINETSFSSSTVMRQASQVVDLEQVSQAFSVSYSVGRRFESFEPTSCLFRVNALPVFCIRHKTM
jgi:hypothetical protein